MIDPKLQAYYDERFAMTSSQGWKDLMEEVEQMATMVGHVNSAADGNQLMFRKGQLDILMWVMNLRKTAKATYQELESNDPSV
jgi:hypothetical protein